MYATLALLSARVYSDIIMWTKRGKSTLCSSSLRIIGQVIEKVWLQVCLQNILLKKEDFEMIRKTIPAFNDFVNDTLRKNVMVLQERIHVSISLSAEEKYS